MIARCYVELSEKHPSIMFLTVDVDELTVIKLIVVLVEKMHYICICLIPLIYRLQPIN